MMRVRRLWQTALHNLLEYRSVLSIGIATAAGIVLRGLFAWPLTNPLLHLVEIEKPSLFTTARFGYELFLFTTPFLLISMFFSFLYIHGYLRNIDGTAGILPPYPEIAFRGELNLVLGEVHHPLREEPSAAPQWLSIPERGLYTGIAAIGSIGSGKTQALILPAMRQLFGYRALEQARKLSGMCSKSRATSVVNSSGYSPTVDARSTILRSRSTVPSATTR